jgi:hypothetical protein
LLIQQRGQLHGEGGGAARLVGEPVGQGRLARRQPVHAGMLEETPILGAQQGGDEGGGDLGQRCPAGSALPGIDTDFLEQGASPVQDSQLG